MSSFVPFGGQATALMVTYKLFPRTTYIVLVSDSPLLLPVFVKRSILTIPSSGLKNNCFRFKWISCAHLSGQHESSTKNGLYALAHARRGRKAHVALPR